MKMNSCVRYTTLALIFLLAAASYAQEHSSPEAKPDDVASVSGIVKASYAAISGPPGQVLNLDRFRSLFLPNAQLVSVRAKDGQAEAHLMTLKEFTEMVSGSIGKTGHVEHELSERAEVYGNIAHVWSTYESRDGTDDQHVTRGINSIQLFNDGRRWWISGAQWQHESADKPIPRKYLSSH